MDYATDTYIQPHLIESFWPDTDCNFTRLKFRSGGKEKYINFPSREKLYEAVVALENWKSTHSITTKGSFMKDIFTDIKTFIKSNNTILYWIALCFLADHFFFNGAFRERLKELVNKLIGRIEHDVHAKIEEKKA